MLLALAALPSCSVFKPLATGDVNYLDHDGYADRRDCEREADKVLESTGPTGDMYRETRNRMRSDLVGQCMKKRRR